MQALLAAALWGATDVLAGIAARRSTPLWAALWLHLASLVCLAPFVSTQSIPLNALVFGSLAGASAAIGDVLFGRALLGSPMSVGIPLANVIACALPVMVIVIQGEHLTSLGVIGVFGAVAASGLAVAPSNGWPAIQGAAYATAAGLCFGLMYALLAQVKSADSLVVVFIMRLAGCAALLTGLFHAGQRSITLLLNGALVGVASGLTSIAANALYIIAMSNTRSKVAASVLAIALSAPAAMVITMIFARERLTRLQAASAASAVGAIAVLALQSV